MTRVFATTVTMGLIVHKGAVTFAIQPINNVHLIQETVRLVLLVTMVTRVHKSAVIGVKTKTVLQKQPIVDKVTILPS